MPSRSDRSVSIALTFFALLAFAANSLLCRMALGSGSLDPSTFTSVRIAAGALMLLPLAKLSARDVPLRSAGRLRSGLALFTYAITFSWAYVSLNTATGALILFASVQVTMLGAGLAAGERLTALAALGVAAAACGLGYLLLPGATAPEPVGALLMIVAGGAWGLYTLWGRGSVHPLSVTAGNFARATVPALLTGALALPLAHTTTRGLALAATSGALTSGLGYAVWYRALRGHSALSAAVVQLSVPVIAAAQGYIVLREQPTQRFSVATLLILGGIALALVGNARAASARKRSS